MKIDELITAYTNKKDPDREERQVGRYYASELGSIIMGYKTPEDFWKPEPIDTRGSKMIQEGNAAENHIVKIFEEMDVPVATQVKKEIQIDDLILVVKTDFLFKKAVVEFKRPAKKSKAIPEKWVYQLEATSRAFDVPVQLWQSGYPFDISALTYTQSDERWELIKKALKHYHAQVLKVATIK